MSNTWKDYLIYYIKSNKRFLILLFALFILLIPMLQNTQPVIYYTQDQLIDFFNYNYLWSGFAIVGFILSVALPLYQFRFLYKKQMNDLYFSLPIKRKKLFLYQFMSGLLVLLIPLIVGFLLGIFFLSMHSKVTYTTEALFILLLLCLGLIVNYTMFSCIDCFCNHIIDALIMSGLYLFIPFLLIWGLEGYLYGQTTQLLDGMASQSFAFLEVVLSLLSPPFVFTLFLRKGEIFNQSTGLYEFHIMNETTWIFVYWILIGIILFFVLKKTFMKRKVEQAEQRTTLWPTYPIMIYLATICIILCLGAYSFSIATLLAAVIVYCGMLFFYKRKIKLSLTNIVIFGLLIATYFGTGALFQHTNGFGMVYEFPSTSSITEVTVMIEGDLEMKEEQEEGSYKNSSIEISTEDKTEITEMTNIQKQIAKWKIKQKKENNELFDDNIGITFSYRKGDDSKSRNYIIYRNEETISYIKELLQNNQYKITIY